MAGIINLRAARKARARTAADAEAAANRVRFGQTKDAKRAAKAEAERRSRLLDGAKLDEV